MNITKPLQQAIRELEQERKKIDSQIEAIRGAMETLGGSNGNGIKMPTKRRRYRMSNAAREAARKRMVAYWKKRKSGKS
jgi:hypothetical protein